MSSCSPGSGGSATYRGESSSYYRSESMARQQSTVARAVAEARYRQMMQELASSAARLSAGEQAYQEGDIRSASRLFMTVARSRSVSPLSAQAKQRLNELGEEARRKVEQVDARLAEHQSRFSPSELLATNGPPPEEWEQAVTDAFQEYEQLRSLYALAPTVGDDLRRHLAVGRRRAENAAVLNEPEAEALLEIAKSHEDDGQACCAYWVYAEAAKLAPANSARRAAQRLAEMEADAELVASAEACRRLRECHKLYARAEKLLPYQRSVALKRFAEVVEKAPPESEVYQAALAHVEEGG